MKIYETKTTSRVLTMLSSAVRAIHTAHPRKTRDYVLSFLLLSSAFKNSAHSCDIVHIKSIISRQITTIKLRRLPKYYFHQKIRFLLEFQESRSALHPLHVVQYEVQSNFLLPNSHIKKKSKTMGTDPKGHGNNGRMGSEGPSAKQDCCPVDTI